MTIKIKLKNGQMIDIKNYQKKIKHTEVDDNYLSIFNELDKNGDWTLSVEEMKIVNKNYNIAFNLEKNLKNNMLLNLFGNDKKEKAILDDINKITPENVHVILAGFQSLTKHSNETLGEWNSRIRTERERARNTELTVTQAIINCHVLNEQQKKECLHKILDAVAKASESNSKLGDTKRAQYINDLNVFIDNLTFNKDTNADLLNALMYVLLPNNGCAQDWKNILTSNGYDIDNLY